MDPELKSALEEVVTRLDAIERLLKARPRKKASGEEEVPEITKQAQELTNEVIGAGLKGARPADYARQFARAKQLLKLKPLEYWLDAVAAMKDLFPYSGGDPWDVFTLGARGHLALAQSQPANDEPEWARNARAMSR